MTDVTRRANLVSVDIEALKMQINAEKEKLRPALLGLLGDSMRRRLAMQDEVRRKIGLSDLPEHPTENIFYCVLGGIESLVSSVRFNDLFAEVGFDGMTGEQWCLRTENSAPKRFGRSILEMLFQSAFDDFCEWEIYNELMVLTEDSVNLMREAGEITSGQVSVPKIPLTTNVRKIGWWTDLSSRVGNILLNESVEYLGDILLLTERRWLHTPNFGDRSIEELKQFLNRCGHQLQSSGYEVEMTPELEEFKDWKSQQE